MAITEGIVLDGLDFNGSGITCEAFSAPAPAKTQEWASRSDADGAVLIRDPLLPNREIDVRLRVNRTSTMDLALAKLFAISLKLEECAKNIDGLPLVWTPANSTKPLTFYVLSYDPDSLPVQMTGGDAGWFVNTPLYTVKMTAKPAAYAAEVTHPNNIGGNGLALYTLELNNVPGDLPAEARLVITEGGSAPRQHVEFGLEWRDYNFTSPPSLVIDSDSMVITGFPGVQATRTGAYDPNATGNNVIRSTVLPVPTAMCSTGDQPHVGTYRVKLRGYPGSTPFYVRLAYKVGDGPLAHNDFVPTIASGAFNEYDLGLITVEAAKYGAQRWVGQIEAYTADGSIATFDTDVLQLIPAGEYYGVARVAPRLSTTTAYTGYDGFAQTAGALNAKALPLGGSWATSGATTDFAVSTSGGGQVQRASGLSGPRFAIAGTTASTDISVQCDMLGALAAGHLTYNGGILLRYVDSSNYLYAVAASPDQVIVIKVIAGVSTALFSGIVPAGLKTIRMEISAAGYWRLWVGSPGQDLPDASVASGTDSALATSGTLASGKSGLFDFGGALTPRVWDNFIASTPPSADAVMFTSQSLEFRTQSVEREDASGTYFGPVQTYRGGDFMLPPAGDKNRRSRVAVKLRRNDVETTVDDGSFSDTVSISVLYRARYLGVGTT